MNKKITVVVVLILAILAGSRVLLATNKNPEEHMEKVRQELWNAKTKEDAARARKKLDKLSTKYNIPPDYFGFEQQDKEKQPTPAKSY